LFLPHPRVPVFLLFLLARLFEGKDYVGALALVGELLKEVFTALII
jgi:hypothetical protein